MSQIMSTFKNIKVGDTVWMESRSPAYRKVIERPLIQGVVVKVGREYFYVKESPDGWAEHKFHKDDGWEYVSPKENCTYRWHAWRTPDDYDRLVQEDRDRSKLAAFFRDCSASRDLTHDQVKAILNIIKA